MVASLQFHPTKFFKNRSVLIYSLLVVLIITIACKTISEDTNRNFRMLSRIPEICMVTHNIRAVLQHQNKGHINPAKQVVEELLQLIMYNPRLCPDKENGERVAVTIVDTARSHFEERQLIRQTWGSVDKYKNWSVRTVFLMGQSDYCLNTTGDRRDEAFNEEKSLKEEFRKYGDLVIGAFVDTYRNLTYKHLMGYKFVQEICPQTDFIIKTDDDMFVDVPGIIHKREMELQAINGENATSSSNHSSSSFEEEYFDIYCHFYHDSPTRDPNGKWFSTSEEWPEDTYPSYCLGNDYAISMDWLQKIYSVKSAGGFFWVDDVFIMGKLREIAEKTFNTSSKRLNLGQEKKMTDARQMGANYVKDNCDKDDVDFGWFVFLVRSDNDFVTNMHCLWRKALQNANITTILYSFRTFV